MGKRDVRKRFTPASVDFFVRHKGEDVFSDSLSFNRQRRRHPTNSVAELSQYMALQQKTKRQAEDNKSQTEFSNQAFQDAQAERASPQGQANALTEFHAMLKRRYDASHQEG